MPWVRIEQSFPRHPKVHPLSHEGFRLHVTAICWCSEQLTDGVVSEEDLKHLWPFKGRGRKTVLQIVEELVASGRWEEVPKSDARRASNGALNVSLNGRQWAIHNYTKYNTAKEQVVAMREASAARQREFKARKRGAGNAGSNGVTAPPVTPPVTLPHTHTHTEVSTKEVEPPPVVLTAAETRSGAMVEPLRADVERLCIRLADAVVANGSRRPTVGKVWRDAARRLMDLDGRTEQQVQDAIDWCQKDEWWKARIQSMTELRKNYDKLRLDAQRRRGAPVAGVSTTDQRVQVALDLAEKYRKQGR